MCHYFKGGKGIDSAAGDGCGRLIWDGLENLPQSYIHIENADLSHLEVQAKVTRCRNFKSGFSTSTFKGCVCRLLKKQTAAVSVQFCKFCSVQNLLEGNTYDSRSFDTIKIKVHPGNPTVKIYS